MMQRTLLVAAALTMSLISLHAAGEIPSANFTLPTLNSYLRIASADPLAHRATGAITLRPGAFHHAPMLLECVRRDGSIVQLEVKPLSPVTGIAERIDAISRLEKELFDINLTFALAWAEAVLEQPHRDANTELRKALQCALLKKLKDSYSPLTGDKVLLYIAFYDYLVAAAQNPSAGAGGSARSSGASMTARTSRLSARALAFPCFDTLYETYTNIKTDPVDLYTIVCYRAVE